MIGTQGSDIPLVLVGGKADEAFRALFLDRYEEAGASYRARLEQDRQAVGRAAVMWEAGLAEAHLQGGLFLRLAADLLGTLATAHRGGPDGDLSALARARFGAAREGFARVLAAGDREILEGAVGAMLNAHRRLAEVGAEAAVPAADSLAGDPSESAGTGGPAVLLAACQAALLAREPVARERCEAAWEAESRLAGGGGFAEPPLCRRAQVFLAAVLEARARGAPAGDPTAAADPGAAPLLATEFCAPYDLAEPSWEGVNPLLLLALARTKLLTPSCQGYLQTARFLDAIEREPGSQPAGGLLREAFNRVYAQACAAGLAAPIAS